MVFNKLSGGTMILVADYAARGEESLEVRSSAFGLSGKSTWELEPAARVLLRCNPGDSLDDLREFVKIGPGLGRIRTATVPLSMMAALTRHPAVQRVQIARYFKPSLDLAIPKIGVPAFRTRIHSRGEGVIVGIVDTGIDGSHPAFAGRILHVWDQTQAGPGVPEGDGVELTGAAIAAQATDEKGHGTHVAGIAAGAMEPYVGVAPEAQIVVVKTDFDELRVAGAMRYLARVIGESGLPGVINLSFGAHLDPHDGTDEISTIINELSRPGLIFCCAAGNERLDKRHAQIKMHQGGNATLQFQIGASVKLAILNGWYSGQDQIEVGIGAPDGSSTPLHLSGASGEVFQYNEGGAIISIAAPPRDQVNGDHHVHVQIDFGPQGIAQPQTWQVFLRASQIHSGRVDFWSSDQLSDGGVKFASNVSDQMLIGSPGCASSGITAGCFASRRAWVSRDGFSRTGPLTENVMSPDSSPGPLRNGALKPDLVAPGNVVISTMAAQSNISVGLLVPGPFKVDHGSSMSTAVTSGLTALLLSQSPQLSPAEAKARLISAASIPGSAPGTFRTDWGYGLVDADAL